jgi:hypothetical protein
MVEELCKKFNLLNTFLLYSYPFLNEISSIKNKINEFRPYTLKIINFIEPRIIVLFGEISQNCQMFCNYRS